MAVGCWRWERLRRAARRSLNGGKSWRSWLRWWKRQAERELRISLRGLSDEKTGNSSVAEAAWLKKRI